MTEYLVFAVDRHEARKKLDEFLNDGDDALARKRAYIMVAFNRAFNLLQEGELPVSPKHPDVFLVS